MPNIKLINNFYINGDIIMHVAAPPLYAFKLKVHQ